LRQTKTLSHFIIPFRFSEVAGSVAHGFALRISEGVAARGRFLEDLAVVFFLARGARQEAETLDHTRNHKNGQSRICMRQRNPWRLAICQLSWNVVGRESQGLLVEQECRLLGIEEARPRGHSG